MKILAIEKEMPNLSSEDFKPHLQEEAEIVYELYQKNIIREIYFRTDKSSAVLVLECSDKTEAEKILSLLPLVKNNLINFEIIPLKAYPGFARLFK
ncbi:MAG: superoxide dismutase [Bacteroidetes bacterium]|nr:superoxide dismutase [Bacteroidota bacterium]